MGEEDFKKLVNEYNLAGLTGSDQSIITSTISGSGTYYSNAGSIAVGDGIVVNSYNEPDEASLTAAVKAAENAYIKAQLDLKEFLKGRKKFSKRKLGISK